MLREDVVQAVEEQRFQVYSVAHVDEAITILTGVEAGSREASGAFPDDTVNRRVEDQLISYAKQRKEFKELSKGDEREA